MQVFFMPIFVKKQLFNLNQIEIVYGTGSINRENKTF